jgi:tetratricopeptide (TPR) repeat protein
MLILIRYRLCWVIVIYFIFSLFVSSPAYSQSSKVLLLAQRAAESAGDTEFKQGNKEADAILQWMTPEEIEALDTKLAEALTLYYDGKFGQALPIFNEIASKVETMDVMWWIGTSAMKSGQLRTAVEKFKKMLVIDPQLHRVRLELAAAYFELGRSEEAKRELETVKAARPPEEVMKNIDRLLAAIEESTRKIFWNVRFSQGIQWDTNISAGPDKKDLAVSGGTLTLDNESKKLSDTASITNFGANLLYDIGDKQGLMWNTALEFYNSAYFNHGKFNYLMTDINTGPWWVGRQDIIKVPVGYTLQDFGSERLSYIFHVNPSYEHFFGQYFSLRGAFTYSREGFADVSNEALDNTTRRYEIGPNFYFFNRQHIISLSAGYENIDARERRFTYESPFYGISYLTRFATNTEIFLRYQWAEKDYKAKPLLYNEDRIDRRHTFTAVLSQGFYKYFFASVAFNYIDNYSNTELYTFDKKTYTVSLGCYF